MIEEFIHDVGLLFGNAESVDKRKVKVEEIKTLLQEMNLTPNSQLTAALQLELEDPDKGWTKEDAALLQEVFPNLNTNYPDPIDDD